MPKVDVLTPTGRKSTKIDLPKEIFAAKIDEDLMAQAVRVYLSNQRRARAKVKSRGEVRGSRRKIWRQKGTGRARHGDRYAPIFVGGGRAHGPTGKENFRLKMSRKMKRRALFSALTSKFKAGDVLVVKDLEKVEPKTKSMAAVLVKVAPQEGKAKRKLTLILPSVLTRVMRAARNIEGVAITQANLLNTYEVLNGGKLIFMPTSLTVAKETFFEKK